MFPEKRPTASYSWGMKHLRFSSPPSGMFFDSFDPMNHQMFIQQTHFSIYVAKISFSYYNQKIYSRPMRKVKCVHVSVCLSWLPIFLSALL